MKNRQNQSGVMQRGTRKPLAAGLCVVAASVLGVGFAADAFGPTTQAGAMTTAGPEVFAGISPVRLLDTRSGVGAPAPGAFGPAETRSLVAAGVGGVPTNATSVAINVTLPRSATSSSFVTVWPSGLPQPETSTSNATPGQAVPNFTVTALGTGGAIDVFNERGNTHIVIDVVGYYIPMPSNPGPAALGGSLLMGLGKPTDDMGDNGDFYIEQAEADMYEKANDSWGEPLIELATEEDAASGPHAIAADGPPAASVGNDGDVYLDTAALEVYGPKASGAWGSGQPIGPDGVGSAFLSGAGAPDGVADGAEGDLYLDSTNAVLYGPKVGTDWGAGQAVGPDGVGSTFLSGAGAPDGAADGVEGDLYLDSTNAVLYGPKPSDTDWGVGQPVGPDGVGSTLLTGAGAPDDLTDGVEGDVYLDTEALELHGPKTGAGWPAPTTELSPGVELQVGSGPPTGLGREGEVYIDRDTLLVYGPLVADGDWATESGVDLAGPPTTASDSAVGATTDAAVLADVGLDDGDLAIALNADIIQVGTALSFTDVRTITVNTAGTYKVTYSIDNASIALSGEARLYVGTGAIESDVLLAVNGSVDQVRLIQLGVGDTIRLGTTGFLAGTSLISASIVVELVAVT